ncbi:MAG: glycosyl hydrolase 108 family protein [Nitrospiria bacterium]
MKLYYGLTLQEYSDAFYDEFDAFFDQLMTDEGGYVPENQARHIKDTGGATSYGISLSFLKGLGINAGDINNDGVIDAKDIVCLTKGQAKELYFLYFWNPLYLQIKSIQIANRLFNFGVNAGKPKAVSLLQQACNDTLQAPSLVVDGVFGQNTLGVVNGIQNQQKLYDNYIISIQSFYQSLNKPQFLSGWIARLKRLLPQSLIDKISS